MRLLLLSCQVFAGEMARVVPASGHAVDVEYLDKDLHVRGGAHMRDVIQERVDARDDGTFDAVALAFGLCNRGLVGLRARHAPLVVTRAHDCIAIFMGSRHAYRERFENDPGTYYLSAGWVRFGDTNTANAAPGPGEPPGAFGLSWPQLVERYGEEEAAWLVEQERAPMRHYRQLVYLDMGAADEDSWAERARLRAVEWGLPFARETGNMRLLRALLAGDWDPRDFLVVPPGEAIAESWDEAIVRAANQ